MSEPRQPVFSIEKIYVKDASSEVPRGGAVFFESGQPDLDLHVDIGSSTLQDGVHEVTLKATVTAKNDGKPLFLVEVVQGGIFQIRDVPDDEMSAVLGVSCPTILFPYVRETVADLVTRAGFPPVHLAPVNFEAMYMARRQTDGANGDSRIEIAH